MLARYQGEPGQPVGWVTHFTPRSAFLASNAGPATRHENGDLCACRVSCRSMTDSDVAAERLRSRRLRPYAVTIFAEMSALAASIGAVNLGQGFPDEDGLPAMLKAAQEAIGQGVNQYPPGSASQNSARPSRANVNGSTASTTTRTPGSGDSRRHRSHRGQRLRSCRTRRRGHRHRTVLRPLLPVLAMAGAHRKAVPMVPRRQGFAPISTRCRRPSPPHQSPDRELAANPTGTVLTDDELRQLAHLATDHDLLVITDEVYEHLVFDAAGTFRWRNTRYARQDGDDLQRGEDVQLHRLEDRMGFAAQRNSSKACGRPSSTSPGVGGAPFQPAVAYALNHEQSGRPAQSRPAGQTRQTVDGARRHRFRGPRQWAPTSKVPIPGRSGMTTAPASLELPEKTGVAAIPMSAF